MNPEARDSIRFEFLDALRGIAAVAVVLEHGLGACVPGYTAWAASHFTLSQFGVCLFLLISGFIIPHSLERCGSNVRFWLRRFWRLMPLYWLSIALAFLCCRNQLGWNSGGPMSDGTVWLVNLTMLQGFLKRPHVSGVYWTLSLELLIYAGCSVLFGLGLLRRTKLVVGVAIAGYIVLGIASILFWSRPFGAGWTFLLLTALFGMVVQRYTTNQLGVRTLFATLAGLVFGLGMAVFDAYQKGTNVQEFDLRSLLCAWAAAYALFACGVGRRGLRVRGVPAWCGRVSYSLYLMHPMVLLMMPDDWPFVQFIPVYLCSTVMVSAATYYLVERSGIALGRKLERRRTWNAASQTTVSELRAAA